jgi:hypothetical protein
MPPWAARLPNYHIPIPSLGVIAWRDRASAMCVNVQAGIGSDSVPKTQLLSPGDLDEKASE